MERKFRMEIEGLWVDITYDFTEGDSGDYMTPPTGDIVNIHYWELAKGEEKQKEIDQLSDDAWDAWMFDIEQYVYNNAEWDILEFEKSLRDEY